MTSHFPSGLLWLGATCAILLNSIIQLYLKNERKRCFPTFTNSMHATERVLQLFKLCIMDVDLLAMGVDTKLDLEAKGGVYGHRKAWGCVQFMYKTKISAGNSLT